MKLVEREKWVLCQAAERARFYCWNQQSRWPIAAPLLLFIASPAMNKRTR
jgi:hypothetical protein